MVFKLGSPYAPDSSVPPNNTGIGGAAQKRINNIVSRYNQSHKNALMVDGNPIYVWIRQPSGQGGVVCSCQQSHKPKSIEPNTPGIKSPKHYDDMTEVVQDDGEAMSGQFIMVHARGGTQTRTNTKSEEIRKTFNLEEDKLPESLGDQFEENPAPDGVQNVGYNKQEIARFLDDSYGGGLFGGDSTACPICYSTGRINGFQIHNGGRIILESSGYWPYVLKNVDILPNRYPTAFKIFEGGYVEWTIDIPFNVYRWCSMGIMDANKPVDALIMKVLWKGEWVDLNEEWLVSTNNTDRSELKVRVMVAPKITGVYTFTHAELRYMQADPVAAQCANLDFPVDYEFSDVIINTSFEVSAEIGYFPRESYFQDSKYGFIWKVNNISPHTTANNQIFGYEVQVRRITKAEMFYSMAMIKPREIQDWNGFNGLQYMQGVFDYNKYPGTDQKAWNVANNEFNFPEKLDNKYGSTNKGTISASQIKLINQEELPDFD